MAKHEKMDKALKRSAVLTLRLTQAEMLTFKLSAMNLRSDRAKLVRERVADLIGMAPSDGAGASSSLTKKEISGPGAEQASTGCKVSGDTANTVTVQGEPAIKPAE